MQPEPESYFIFLNKPVGISSQQCLSRFKREQKVRKIGHFGTLDPFASGLLLAGVNQATKYFSYIDDSKKTYEAVLCLGTQTDTLDNTGTVIQTKNVPRFDIKEIQKKLLPLTGEIKQTPPMYSAIKQKGVRLYELARQGKVVKREERTVFVYKLTVLEWKSPLLKISTTVSRGTYVRVLAEQMAQLLGTVAHVTGLCRSQLCGQNLEQAYSFENEISFSQKKIPISDLLSQYPRVSVSLDEAQNIIWGKVVNCDQGGDPPKNMLVRLFCGDVFLGMGSILNNQLVPQRLMNTQHLLS